MFFGNKIKEKSLKKSRSFLLKKKTKQKNKNEGEMGNHNRVIWSPKQNTALLRLLRYTLKRQIKFSYFSFVH